MRSFSPKKAAMGLGAAGALALGIAVPAVAFADPTPAPSGTATSSPDKAADKRPDRDQAHAKQRAALAEALAKELGIPQDKVAAALEKIEAQRAGQAKAERLSQLKRKLDQAVEDGKLTREQADAILKAAEAGVLPGGIAGKGEMWHHRGPGDIGG